MPSIIYLTTRCRECGADIVFPEGINVVACEACDCPNARPVSESKEIELMEYANERCDLGEFDDAAFSYRKVLQKNIEEHEARWGLLLCKYGVIYVEDPASRERLITCRRAVHSSMRAEPDFKICCQQADEEVRASYKREAE